MEDTELIHYGKLGMRWGHRSGKALDHLISKDVKRYADAKMFYGETAGNRRKLLKAELDRKKKRIPGYEEKFTKAVEDYDYASSAKKAKIKRTALDTKKSAKRILTVVGPLTVTAGTALYYANKTKVDSFVTKQVRRAVSSFAK